jgi:serine/threonine-protein kinase
MESRRVAWPGLEGREISIRSPDHPVRERYRLHFLSRGGMSCAYRAQVGQRNCFVKEVPLAQLEDVHHLRAESQMLQRLPLGNFPRFVEIFEEDQHLYLVTEFLEGLTLEQEVQRNPWTFPEETECQQLALSLCRQLEILHALKPPILFLDLKPANVIRSPKGGVYLVDFGISRVFLPPFVAGDFRGSPQTASPEHFTGKLDPRSDLYSMAATVHFVATRGQAQRMDLGPFPSVQEFHPDLSSEFDQWLQKCLKLKPSERYVSVQEARLALERGPLSPPPPAARRNWLAWLKRPASDR